MNRTPTRLAKTPARLGYINQAAQRYRAKALAQLRASCAETCGDLRKPYSSGILRTARVEERQDILARLAQCRAQLHAHGAAKTVRTGQSASDLRDVRPASCRFEIGQTIRVSAGRALIVDALSRPALAGRSRSGSIPQKPPSPTACFFDRGKLAALFGHHRAETKRCAQVRLLPARRN